jgi:O-antigen ligase
MDFTSIVLFLAVYYLKPQEWSSIFSTVRFAALNMVLSVAALFLRPQGLKARDLLRTPHDWAMLAFFAWVVLSNQAPVEAFKEFLNRIVFYIVIVQTLTNWERVKRFLGWWCAIIVVVACLAIAGEYFFDPLGSHDVTHGIMKERLVLNLSMMNNPNALGHAIVPVIPMLYFFCIWKRPVFLKEVGLLAFIAPIWAVYLTYSKGAYVAGAAAVLATFTFGRPKIVQAAVIALAIAGGFTALETLPRMGELQKAKTDEAIQGRIRAFTYGKQYYDELTRGVGQGQFINTLLREHNYYKASHSTYVQTGAELGWPGLLLFLLIVWTNFRTLLFAKTQNAEQERVRRVLFVLVVTYCVSGWMVDFAYRATFFMFTAAIAAFHRLLYLPAEELEAEGVVTEIQPGWQAVLATQAALSAAHIPAPPLELLAQPVLAKSSVAVLAGPDAPAIVRPWLRGEVVDFAAEDAARRATAWNRLGMIDLAIAVAMLLATAWLWSYVIRTF